MALRQARRPCDTPVLCTAGCSHRYSAGTPHCYELKKRSFLALLWNSWPFCGVGVQSLHERNAANVASTTGSRFSTETKMDLPNGGRILCPSCQAREEAEWQRRQTSSRISSLNRAGIGPSEGAPSRTISPTQRLRAPDPKGARNVARTFSTTRSSVCTSHRLGLACTHRLGLACTHTSARDPSADTQDKITRRMHALIWGAFPASRAWLNPRPRGRTKRLCDGAGCMLTLGFQSQRFVLFIVLARGGCDPIFDQMVTGQLSSRNLEQNAECRGLS